MPGFVGLVRLAPDPDVRSRLESLLTPMRREPFSAEAAVDPGGRWGLARVDLGIFNRDPQLTGTAPVRVLFRGSLHNASEVRETLAREGAAPDDEGVLSLLANLYRRRGPDFGKELRGAYCAVVLDENAGRLMLATDRVGSYPLYWHRGPEAFTFASELKAVLRAGDVTPEMNPRAVADFLKFGFLFGEKTLARDVWIVPAGATLTFDWTSGETRLDRHFDYAAMLRDADGDAGDYRDRVADAFRASVHRALDGDHRFVVSLSGGLDSRTIIGAAGDRRRSLSTYTLGVRGCADEHIARDLSRITGTRHRFFELDARYLGEFLSDLREMVRLSDGMYMTHGLTEMLALRCLEDTDYEVLLRGHGGELAKLSLAWPLHTDAAVWAMRTTDELVPYLLQRLSYLSRGEDPEAGIFTDEWHEALRGAARRSLEESLEGRNLTPANACTWLYLEEHHRRFTVPSLELFRNRLEVRLPFVDDDFLPSLFAGDPAWRNGTDIHRRIVGRFAPDLARIRNSNTGAPVDAGPLLEAFLGKVNTVFQRLGVPGYRHYHHFQGWMRNRLAACVEEVLLEPGALARGIYREDGLRRLLQETKDGSTDHGYLLQVLLILEVWQQEFC